VKGAPFDIPEDVARAMLAMPTNPNGAHNSSVVKIWIIGRDLVQRPSNQWIIDFGVDMTEPDAALFEAPFEYVRRVVRPAKLEVKGARESERWWLHNRPIPGMRAALTNLRRYVATPATAKHRIFAWIEQPALVSNSVIAFARADDYMFGVLHSRAHEIWSIARARRQGVGNDPVYSVASFETFPLPWPPGQEPVDDPRVIEIAAAAKDLDAKRTAWLNPHDCPEAELKKRTLTNLYNARPAWLAAGHDALDRAVWAAYG
jgi:hypothetical protein